MSDGTSKGNGDLPISSYMRFGYCSTLASFRKIKTRAYHVENRDRNLNCFGTGNKEMRTADRLVTVHYIS